MRQILYFLACVGLCISSICSAQSVSTITKSVKLSKVVFNSEVDKANQRVKVGTICLFSGKPVDFGSGARTLGRERFERLFSGAMKEHGFNVIATSSDLFESEDASSGPDFLIGATFRVQSVDICEAYSGYKGALTISVDWQIYNRSKQQVVETAISVGSGQVAKFQSSGIDSMIDQAFSASVTTLIKQGTIQKYLGDPTP